MVNDLSTNSWMFQRTLLKSIVQEPEGFKHTIITQLLEGNNQSLNHTSANQLGNNQNQTRRRHLDKTSYLE